MRKLQLYLVIANSILLADCSRKASGPVDAGTDGGVIDGGVVTKLPALPALTNVTVTQRPDSVGIDFNPVDGAVDYRVYPLPDDADITVNADGTNTVKNAVYRCAGLRQPFDVPNNLDASDAGLATYNGQYSWQTQIAANPTLGYVHPSPGPGLIPVYAVAGNPSSSEQGWRESRFKIYTTDSMQRQMLLGQSWRDDGIVFYVPSAPSSATQTVYSSQNAHTVAGQGWTQYQQYYFGQADLDSHSHDDTPPAPAFQVLSAPAAGTEPLMAVFYAPAQQHTELAVGNERFQRAAYQGVGPLWHVEWSGLSGSPILVVEALASGCPFQGFLSPQHLAAPPHQTLFTVNDLQAASPTGEVFINGEYDETTFPKAIARSFIQTTPHPPAAGDWDWYQGFDEGSDAGTVTAIPGCTDSNCGRWQSSIFDFSMYRIDEPAGIPLFTYGQTLGQFWEVFDDTGSDVTGKVRFTARQNATVAADTFLHATMTVNIVSTDRRYPQLIISDQAAPVQEGLANPNNNTLLVQAIEGPSMRIEAQAIHGLVNGKPWDVNNQAPEHRFIDYDNNYTSNNPSSSPTEPPFEHAGMDRMTRFDVYVSSQQMYLFFDGAPVGCSQFPSDFALSGTVTVTFGDVLYHEGAPDELVCAQTKPYAYLHLHQCTETTRHFDDLGFKSGVPAPPWDETKMPCVPY